MTVQSDKTVKAEDLESKRPIHSLEGQKGEIFSVALTPDGIHAVSVAGGDATVKVWELETGRLLRTLERPKENYAVGALSLTPDGEQVVAARGSSFDVWDLASGQFLRSLNPPLDRREVSRGGTLAITVHPNGKYVVSGSLMSSDDSDNTVRVWNLATGEIVRRLEGTRWMFSVKSVAVARDGVRLVAGSGDTTIKVWDLNSSQLLKVLEGHQDDVNTVAVTPDGAQVVSGSGDTTIKVWDPLQWPAFAHTERARAICSHLGGDSRWKAGRLWFR